MTTAKSALPLSLPPRVEQTSSDLYQKLRRKLRGEAITTYLGNKPGLSGTYRVLVESLTLLPDLFHLSLNLLLDKCVPTENKGALVAVLIYVLSPVDFLPDILPITGWVDDLVVLVIGLNKFLETDKPEVRAAVQRHWAGTGEAIGLVKHLLSVADEAVEFLPKKLMRMMKDIFKA
jgi:uncharacterized membrane protein YkvA (DUF1232 family)